MCIRDRLLTAITQQNDAGVKTVKPVSPNYLLKQWSLLKKERSYSAIKVGLVPDMGSSEAVKTILSEAGCPSVVDTPFFASSGGKLVLDDPVKVYEPLFPLTSLLTPNAGEAETLTKIRIENSKDVTEAGHALTKMCRAVLIKGGHIDGEYVTDTLFAEGKIRTFSHKRSNVQKRGTGCFLSSSIAGNLARGLDLETAVDESIKSTINYITEGNLLNINKR